jgi:hypothetical protein
MCVANGTSADANDVTAIYSWRFEIHNEDTIERWLLNNCEKVGMYRNILVSGARVVTMDFQERLGLEPFD